MYSIVTSQYPTELTQWGSFMILEFYESYNGVQQISINQRLVFVLEFFEVKLD